MAWEVAFVILLLILALVSFIKEKIPPDLTALSVFAILVLVQGITHSEKLPNLKEMFQVFTNSAPITIACMFIVSAAVQNCGVVDSLSALFEKVAKFGYIGFLLVMMLLIAGVSGFVNNTPVVVILLPVVITLARKIDQPASKLLIPLSYASILGGTCTLIGTSTNILASGIITEPEYGMEPIRMFELARIGLPLMGIGILYLLIFGKKLLPVRETLTTMLTEEQRMEFLTEVYVKPEAEIIGQNIQNAGLGGKRGIRVLEIIRHGVSLYGDISTTPLEAGDRLILKCRPSGVAEARGMKGLDLVNEAGGLEQITAEEGTMVEGVVAPNADIAGRSIREINFRQRFRTVVMAVHRQGRNISQKLRSLHLRPGDTLLMLGTQEAIENLRSSSDILLLDKPQTPAVSLRRKLPIVLAVLAGIILSSSFHLMPIAGSTIIGVVILFLTGCMKPKEGYAAVDWGLLILIYGMLVLGTALQKSGATELVANSLSGLAGWLPFEDPHVSAMLMLAVCYVATAVLTELLSNNATVVVMTPIAIGLAASLGVDPRPFVIATCIAASASFSTPIGYQTNTYVYSVGGYRFGDFLKVGLPLAILYCVGSLYIIPKVWSF